ncbi:MAG: LamG domain-containing protein [Gemmatimonadota bacterium]
MAIRAFRRASASFGAVALVVAGCGGDDSGTAPSDPLLEGLEAYYTFDGSTDDVSGNARHATLIGGASVTGGVLVTGSNDVDALEVPRGALDGVGDFTVSGWVKMSTFHIYPSQWLSCAIAAEDNNLGVWYDPNNDRWSIDILGDRLNFSTNSAMEDNQFHHIVVVRNGTTVVLYVDGAQAGSVTVLSDPIDIDPGGLIVGQDQDSVGGGFTTNNSLAGEVDELRFYSRALSTTDVAAILALGR